MSGHSKWATTHRQKAIVDAKRGAIFTKLGNQIAIAARGGTDPALNSSLAMAIEKLRLRTCLVQTSSERLIEWRIRARQLWKKLLTKVMVLAAWALLLKRRQIIVIEHCQK